MGSITPMKPCTWKFTFKRFYFWGYPQFDAATLDSSIIQYTDSNTVHIWVIPEEEGKRNLAIATAT